MKKYTSKEILVRMATATQCGYSFLVELLKENGNFIDTQNIDKKRDGIYGICMLDDIQKEVSILAIKLVGNTIYAFCGTTESPKFSYTKEDMERLFHNSDDETDCGFWEFLVSGELWALPTMQSILESIEQYV